MNPRARVLVVDDDPDIRESIQLVLELEGYHVSTAADGREALAAVRAERPTLILLDLMMPGMNGFEFRGEQLLDRDLANIPVVVISADGNVSDKAGGLAAEGIRKPLELDALLSKVRRYAPA